MNSAQPLIKVFGVDCILDVTRDLLFEKANPDNQIMLKDTFYDPIKNNYIIFRIGLKLSTRLGRDPDFVLPSLSSLDPAGMAKTYGKSLEDVKRLSDVLIVNSAQAINERISLGRQPSLMIHGHRFFVNYHMGQLEPEGKPLSGFPFEVLKNFWCRGPEPHYIIPYKPATLEFVPLDFDTLTKIPNGVHLVKFPTVDILDPYGFARDMEFDVMEVIRFCPIVMQRNAEAVSWQDIALPNLDVENLKKTKKQREFKQNIDQTKARKKNR
ncbi:hypothetical protein [Chitinophaga rhizosphaerae]|uniref:hypothetical protein n=1 Tax=Chitinophaga rhizosphaerae TaxID=1864947 RepID=UPI000F80E5C5|nr:hypothetical protein [Chitinophaga rhizosphaerae]